MARTEAGLDQVRDVAAASCDRQAKGDVVGEREDRG